MNCVICQRIIKGQQSKTRKLCERYECYLEYYRRYHNTKTRKRMDLEFNPNMRTRRKYGIVKAKVLREPYAIFPYLRPECYGLMLTLEDELNMISLEYKTAKEMGYV